MLHRTSEPRCEKAECPRAEHDPVQRIGPTWNEPEKKPQTQPATGDDVYQT